MPQPITVYRGSESVPNVYLSELQAWLADGWSTEPQPEEKPVKKTTKKVSPQTESVDE